MSEMIANTVQFRFPVGSPRPTLDETANFLKQLEADVLQMEAVYKTAHDRSIFIKFASMDAMKEALRRNAEPRNFLYTSGRTVEVQMSTAGANVRYVRVFDLPPEIKDDNLSLVLGEFGKVDRVIREKFPTDTGLSHLHTGVRGLYMDITKNIPPTIDVVGRKGRVYYDGLENTCFLCLEVGHRRDSCPRRRKTLEKNRKQTSAPLSYAAVASANEAVSEEREPTETSEDSIVEVLNEDDAGEKSDDHPADTLNVDLAQPAVCDQNADLEKDRRRKKAMEELEEMAETIKIAMENPQARQRRAQFAVSGSGSGSASGSRPKKKCARKTYY